jgi:hypothetical protein
MSDTGRLFNYFWYFVDISKNAFLYNSSSFQATIGRRRSGKSVFCLGAACAVDPDLLEENICFGLKELKEQLNTKQETALIWEEAGASAYNRDFMEQWNKLIVKTLQVYGYRKLALYANFQHLKFIDIDVRMQLDSFFRMKAINGFSQAGEPITSTYAEPYTVVTDYIQEPIISPYKIAREGIYQNIGKIPIPEINEFFKITGVKKSLYKAYLKRKDEYFQDLGEEEKQEDKELFSRKELKTLTRVNESYLNLASNLINEKFTKKKIAALSDIPVSTLNFWLSRAGEAAELQSRVSAKETTTK